jgi:hypothetical protein
MKLELIRRYCGNGYTIGTLSIDGVPFCDTLEDTDRGLKSSMTLQEIKANKVKGKTAIPTGIYHVDMNTVSPRLKNKSYAKPYGGRVPRLQGVKGFDGVLIHPGNTADDTEGCILVGRNTEVGKLTDSKATYCKLFEMMDAANEHIIIEIRWEDGRRPN